MAVENEYRGGEEADGEYTWWTCSGCSYQTVQSFLAIWYMKVYNLICPMHGHSITNTRKSFAVHVVGIVFDGVSPIQERTTSLDLGEGTGYIWLGAGLT